MRNLIVKIMQTSGAQIYSMLLGMITLSITAHVLGAEGRGIIATISTWMIFLAEFGELSLSGAIIYNATHHKTDSWISEMMGVLSLHTVIVTLVSWALIIFLFFGGAHWDFIPNVFQNTPGIPLIVGFLILPLLMWEFYTRTLLNIEDRIGVYNKFQMIGSTVNSLSLVTLILGGGVGVIAVFISKIFWQVIIAMGGIRDLLKRKTKAISVDLNKYKDLITKGSKMHLNMIGAMMLTNIDIIMVSAYLGNTETGIYQLAVQTSLMMMTVPYAVMTILQGEVTRKGVHGIWGHQKKLLFLTLGFMIGAAIITSLTAQWWLIWLAGEEFREAITVFKYLCIWVVVSTATAILSVQWIARGLFLQLSATSIFTGIMNIVLNAVFIPKYGMMGAVWATMGTAVVALIINVGMFIWVERDVRRHARLEAKTITS